MAPPSIFCTPESPPRIGLIVKYFWVVNHQIFLLSLDQIFLCCHYWTNSHFNWSEFFSASLINNNKLHFGKYQLKHNTQHQHRILAKWLLSMSWNWRREQNTIMGDCLIWRRCLCISSTSGRLKILTSSADNSRLSICRIMLFKSKLNFFLVNLVLDLTACARDTVNIMLLFVSG